MYSTTSFGRSVTLPVSSTKEIKPLNEPVSGSNERRKPKLGFELLVQSWANEGGIFQAKSRALPFTLEEVNVTVSRGVEP
jgi:hypothetical protein